MAEDALAANAGDRRELLGVEAPQVRLVDDLGALGDEEEGAVRVALEETSEQDVVMIKISQAARVSAARASETRGYGAEWEPGGDAQAAAVGVLKDRPVAARAARPQVPANGDKSAQELVGVLEDGAEIDGTHGVVHPRNHGRRRERGNQLSLIF